MAILDPVLGPLLSLHPLLAIVIISFLISLFIVFIYKKFTNQDLMKRLKTEIKELQAEMKQLRDKPDKMMKVQRKAMETNTKYMMQSFKPTLLTFIPIIIVFGWLNAHMAYWPITDGLQFPITIEFEEGASGTVALDAPTGLQVLDSPDQEIAAGKAEWVLAGEPDTYTLRYSYSGREFEHRLIITESTSERDYAKPVLTAKDLGMKETGLAKLTIGNKKVQPLKAVPLIGSIPWIGNFGWLGTYILFSLVFSIALRKILKVY